MKLAIACFVIAGFIGSAVAATQQRPTFTSQSAAVRLVVSVNDQNGTVRGLQAGDFIVTDNGQKQSVNVDEGADAPLDLMIVSQPMDSIAMTSAEQAARMLAGLKSVFSLFRDGDRVGAILAGAPPTRLRGLEPGRPAFGERAFLRGEYAAPFDAIAGALPELKDSERRQALIAFTAGADFRSTLTPDALARAAERRGPALIFIAAPIKIETPFASSGSPTRGVVSGWSFPDALRDLARTTGGLTLDLGRGDPSTLVADLISRLRTQYVLSYTAPSEKGWHAVSVKVNRKGAVAATRNGYSID